MKRIRVMVLVGVLLLSWLIGYCRTEAVEYLTVKDFIATANKAKWRSSSGEQPFPGKALSRTGSALWVYDTALENGTQYSLLLQTSPDIQEKGYIIGTYSDITIPENARLNTEFGFLADGSETDGVTFSVSFQVGRNRATTLFEKFKSFNRKTEKIILDLPDYANQTGSLIIKVSGNKPALDDLAAWSKLALEVEKAEKGPPDLIVTNITVKDRLVNFTIKNIGKSPTPSLRRGQSIDTILTMNGKEVSMDKLTTVLDPQEEISRIFPDYMLPDTKADQTLLVCTDTAFTVTESDENNNCLQIKIKPDPVDEDPDLIITMIQLTLGKVSYSIKNVGKGPTSSIQRGRLFQVNLSLDGKEVAVDNLNTILAPGEEVSHGFTDFLVPTSKAEQFLLVCADSNDAFVETDEHNNCLMKKIPPVPPEEDLRFVSFPLVSRISPTSVNIAWETNIESDSRVLYDTHFQKFSIHMQDSRYTQQHNVTLSPLKPDSLYQFYVRCVDKKGSQIQSENVLFKTLPERIDEIPTIRFLLPGELSGIIRIKPDLSDVKHFSRMQLLVDNALFFSNYASPFDVMFDTKKLPNGIHEFTLQGIDRFGNKITVIQEGLVANPDIKLNKGPIITFVSPADDTDFPNTTEKIPIKAIIDHKLKFSITTIDILIDGNLTVTIMPSMTTGYWANGSELPKTFEYDIPIERFTSGQHVVSLRISDNQQVETSAERTIVTHTPIWSKPALFVSYKTSTTPSKTGYRVDVCVSNLGNVKAKDITLQIKQNLLPGFLISSINKQVKYQLVTNYIQVMEIQIPELGFDLSNREWHIQFDMTPVLTQDVDLDQYVIFNQVAIIYDWVDNPNKPVWDNIAISKIAAFDTMLQFFNADYLIVSNITNLSIHNPNWFTSLNELLDQMGQLAIQKQGVIGLLTDSQLSANQVYNKINYWGAYLTPSWKSSGYLLIVGETEIVPAFCKTYYFDSKYYKNIGSEYLSVTTDSLYANTVGKPEIPELAIGRIIGDNSQKLLLPIQNSVDVNNGNNIFLRNHHQNSKVYCFSGTGEGEAEFWTSAYTIGEIIKQEFTSVDRENGRSIIQQGNTLFDRIVAHSFNLGILVYRGHGSPYCFCGDDIAADSRDYDAFKNLNAGNFYFGKSRPFIFACCCSAGEYAGIYGIAECFLEKAGAYIGSTQISFRPSNNYHAQKFFQKWINYPTKSLGTAFKETRINASFDPFWSDEYQFYGDPKFGTETP